MKQKQLFITLAILALAIALSACGAAIASTPAGSGAAIPEITIKAFDYSFAVPDQLEAGLVKINLVNDGQELHHAQIARLNEGITLEQFQTALQQDPEAAFPLITFVGGPGVVDPGRQAQVTVELSPGQYVLLCFLPSHDGVPHLAKGMLKPIEVVAHTDHDHPDVSEPKADAMVKLLDFSFVLPSEIKAGEQLWQVVNEGSQPHEVLIIKLAEGKTMADLQAFVQTYEGVPPYANLGGFQAITPGESGWLHLNLEPGNYVAICYVPDPASGHAHAELGMVIPFTVK
ncbi:MAG: hypothetical protein HS126_33195 [Anaerolineales bacterium]|nr:hypothetical protein [Anaerolineales bacterium]